MAQLEVDRQTRKATRRPDTRPSHDLADYAGDYEHPGYGRITITHAEGILIWAYRGMSEALMHRHYDTFELPEAPEAPGGPATRPARNLIFHRPRREIASLAVPFEPFVKDIVFTHTATGDFFHLPNATFVARRA
jgi:hypothetical protein